MRVLKTVLISVAALLFITLIFGLYIGYFSEVRIEEKQEGGYTIAGMEFTGPYSQTGKFMQEVNKKLREAGFECQKGFGIYYDDPKMVPAEKCRSFVGSILDDKYRGRISELKTAGFRIDSVPFQRAIVSEFPVKNSLSYIIGTIKIYPALSKYMSDKGYKCNLSMEVYDIPGKKIIYMMQY